MRRGSVTLVLGLVALAGSLVVLGATVLRIQNLRTTVDRPKASEASCLDRCYDWDFNRAACDLPSCQGCPEQSTVCGSQRDFNAPCELRICRIRSNFVACDSPSVHADCGSCPEYSICLPAEEVNHECWQAVSGTTTCQSEALPLSTSCQSVGQYDDEPHCLDQFSVKPYIPPPSKPGIGNTGNTGNTNTTSTTTVVSNTTSGSGGSAAAASDSIGGSCSDAAPGCCSQIAAGAGFDACSWGGADTAGSRGWCRPEQCAGSNNTDSRCSHEKGDPELPRKGPKNCNCGLFWNSYCVKTCNVPGSVLSDSQYPMPSQTGVDLNPTMTWAFSSSPTGGDAYANIRIWSCAGRTDDCMVFANAPSPFTSVPINSFYREPGQGKGTSFAAEWSGDHVSKLMSNKQYWWQLTWGVSSCGVACANGIPGDSRYPCQTWAFMTGSGSTPPPGGGGSKTCNLSLSSGSVSVGQPVSISVSGSTGVLAHVSRTDDAAIPGLGNVVYTDSQRHKYYNVSGSFTPQSAGTYKFWCDVGGGAGQCSGNEFCPYNKRGGTLSGAGECQNWVSCSENDSATLEVGTPEVPKTCSVQLSAGSIESGKSVTVTTSNVSGGTVSTYITRTDNNDGSITGFTNASGTNGHKYYQFTGGALNNLPPGKYKVWCDVTF